MHLSRTFHVLPLLCAFLVGCGRREEPVDVSLSRGDIAALERALGSIQSRFEAGKASELDLRNSFRPFYLLDPQVTQTLQSWVAERPQSYAAHLSLGINLKRQGAQARGTAYRNETPQGNFERMDRYMNEAEAELRASLALTAKPYLSIFHLLDVYGTRGDRTSPQLLVAAADAMLPGNFLVRSRHAVYLLPRWGGSYEDLETFISNASAGGVPPKVVQGLKAIELDDKGRVLAARGQEEAADEYFERAATLAHGLEDSFVADFLPGSRDRSCRSGAAPARCR